jgi:CheY-like chemotaxis protein
MRIAIEMLQEILEGEGFWVELAQNGKKLRKLRSLNLDLVL